MIALTVLTLNLRNINDRYDERRPLLIAGFAAIAPEIAGLQEVMLGEHAQDEMLASAAQSRQYRALRAESERFPGFGNSVLVGVGEAQAHERLPLGHGRAVQRVLVALAGTRTLWVVNTHLHHRPGEPLVRVEQAEAICHWMATAPAADATIVMGDFNTPPFEPAYGIMTAAGYRSACLEANGREPDVTWPSGIQCETMDTDGDPNCLDYIWLLGSARASAARLVFTEHAPGDPTLYPSDHFGILATLEL